MAELEYRCFVGGLAGLPMKEAFKVFGNVITHRSSATVRRVVAKGFVTFTEQTAMNNAIEMMNGQTLDGRTITVNQDQQKNGADHGSGYRGGSRSRNIRGRVGGSQGDNSRAQEEGSRGAHDRGVRGYGGGGYVSDGYQSDHGRCGLYSASKRISSSR